MVLYSGLKRAYREFISILWSKQRYKFNIHNEFLSSEIKNTKSLIDSRIFQKAISPIDIKIPKNNKIRTDFDHRIAMSFAVMGSKVGNLIIEDVESINTSFPNFIEKFNNAGGNIL